MCSSLWLANLHKHLKPCFHILVKQEAYEGEVIISMSSSNEEGAQQFKTDAEADSSRRSLQDQNAAQKYIADVSASILEEASPPATGIRAWGVQVNGKDITITFYLTYPEGTSKADVESNMKKVQDSAAVKSSSEEGATALKSYGIDETGITVTGEASVVESNAAHMYRLLGIFGVLAPLAAFLIAA